MEELKIATTKIWAVKDSINRVVTYTINPNKTDFNQFAVNFESMTDLMNYVTSDSKTKKNLCVSGVNCNPSTAVMEMKATKQRYFKEDKILAFHAVQSFKPNEVTPELCHKIGLELAEILWGDRFEVVVSTHLDKAHLHNHFVINSVSFADGKKYYDNKETYRNLRKQSDFLCEKYSLSVIKKPKDRGMHYAEYDAERNGKHTTRKEVRKDVDEAISKSRTFTQFIKELRLMGYEVNTNRKHITLKPPGNEKRYRLRSLSKDDTYDEPSIKERILMNTKVHLEPFQEKIVFKVANINDLKKGKRITGIKGMYIKYMFLMGILPKHAPRKKVHFIFREDLRYMEEITREVTLLKKNNINTLEDLENKIESLEARKKELIKERKCYYNKVSRKSNKNSVELIKQDIETLTKEIQAITKEVRSYEGIKLRSFKMKENINKVNVIESEVERNERRGRNGRSSRENDTARD